MKKVKSNSNQISTSHCLDKEEKENTVEERKDWGMIVSFFYLTAYHLNVILMSACVHVSKKNSNNQTFLQLNTLQGTSLAHHSWVYNIAKGLYKL